MAGALQSHRLIDIDWCFVYGWYLRRSHSLLAESPLKKVLLIWSLTISNPPTKYNTVTACRSALLNTRICPRLLLLLLALFNNLDVHHSRRLVACRDYHHWADAHMNLESSRSLIPDSHNYLESRCLSPSDTMSLRLRWVVLSYFHNSHISKSRRFKRPPCYGMAHESPMPMCRVYAISRYQSLLKTCGIWICTWTLALRYQ